MSSLSCWINLYARWQAWQEPVKGAKVVHQPVQAQPGDRLPLATLLLYQFCRIWLPPAFGLGLFVGGSTEALQSCPRAPPPQLRGEKTKGWERCGRLSSSRQWKWKGGRLCSKCGRLSMYKYRLKERVQLLAIARPLQGGHAKTFLSAVCCFGCPAVCIKTHSRLQCG